MEVNMLTARAFNVTVSVQDLTPFFTAPEN
jgi:hypothetical protein